MDEASEAIGETDGAAGAPADAALDDAREAAEIERMPLAERAPRYQAVAERLREELEHSDPSRGDA
ncbi:hypothetical protein ABIQ69_09855 [Agromyces sp. G08B096]|uniref:Uncharacterized protein n=1 Tax=Agromyces sp. G08B096 TaxID=3156399 RepID=A0AAU7W273_9MICO